MLFGQLKIIMEADKATEPELDANGNPIEVKQSKTQNQKDIEKKSTDGVGKKEYKMATKLATVFSTNENLKVDGKSLEVKSSANTLTLVGAKNASAKNPLEADEILSVIQQVIQAAMGEEFDKFDLAGPIISGEDFIFSVLPKATTKTPTA